MYENILFAYDQIRGGFGDFILALITKAIASRTLGLCSITLSTVSEILKQQGVSCTLDLRNLHALQAKAMRRRFAGGGGVSAICSRQL